MRLDGKIVIVIGGVFGFGVGIVCKFVSEGVWVLIVDLNIDLVNEVVVEVGGLVVYVDVL